MDALMCLVVALSTVGQVEAGRAAPATFEKELEYQRQNFKQWWGTELVTKLDELPDVGSVPFERVPYSGHDYPDRAGGTYVAMAKYDRAFHRGRSLASEYERADVGAHRRGRSWNGIGRGLFARFSSRRTPAWYGHCNGWTAAAIRHAEPQHSVTRNGVVFRPADIKGLLAELYMYSETEFLGGETPIVNPGVLHLTISNWLGRGQHPVGMEAVPGEVVVNYPIFTYRYEAKKRGEHEADVKLSVRYAMNTNYETDKSPAFNRTMYFHYALDLNDDGEITGGHYYGDSARVDMLWTPLKPVQGGKKGNERGNPHMDVDEVLAIWRESVSESVRKKWFNVDPTEEDAILPQEEEESVEKVVKDGDKPQDASVAKASGSESPEREAAPATNASTLSAPTRAPTAASTPPPTPAADPEAGPR